MSNWFTRARAACMLGLATVAAFGLMGPDGATARPVDCELTVNGRPYTDGSCDFESLGTDGSFILRGGRGIFVYVTVTRPGVAEASWNETPRSTHAQAPLGEVRRDGGCWTSQRATICAWTPGQRPAQRQPTPPGSVQTQFQPAPTYRDQVQAQAQPAPRPAPAAAPPRPARPVTFYAQTARTQCIQAGGPIRELTPVVIGDCMGPGAVFVVAGRGTKLAFAANQRFCIGFANDGAAQILQCDGVEQDYAYDARSETIRFSPIPGTPDDCLGARGVMQIGARVVIERCAANAVDQRYSMSDPVAASAQPAPPQSQPAPQPPRPAPGGQRAVSIQTVGFPETLCFSASRLQALAPIGIGLSDGGCDDARSRFVYDAQARRLRFAANPRLCFGFEVGGEALAAVWPCDEVFVDLAYDARTNTIRRVGEPGANECVGLRGQMRMGARARLEDCGRNAADQRYELVPLQ